MERINHFISIWLERVGIVALLVMLAVTCIDVIGTKCFGSPFLGAIDVITLSQVVAIAFAIAIAQISGRHIHVDFFLSSLSDRSQAVVDSFIYLLQTLFFAIIVWRIYMLGRALRVAEEVSATLFAPLYPFLYIMAFGFVPIALICLVNSINAAMKVVRK